MRRIASVFRKKPAKSDSAKDEEDKRSVSTARPRLLANARPPVPSTSSTSTASTDLRTPEDDRPANHFPSPSADPTSTRAKRAWISSWVGSSPSRRSTSSVRLSPSELGQVERPPPLPTPAPAAPSARVSHSLPPVTPTQRTYSTPRPGPVTRVPARKSGAADESDDSTTDDSDSEPLTAATPRPPRPTTQPRTTSAPAAPVRPGLAATNLRALTLAGLVPPFSPPPLLHLPGKALFPRSSNAHGALVRAESVRTWMLKKALVRRLERRKGARPLSVSEERSIAPFAARTPGEGACRSSFQLDEGAVRGSDKKRIGAFSAGLRTWASRPPFEDRVAVFAPDMAGGIAQTRVAGRPGLAVDSLEVSPGLEALAGLRDGEPIYGSPLPASSSSSLLRAYRPSPRESGVLIAPL
jgi:hypothetical protein